MQSYETVAQSHFEDYSYKRQNAAKLSVKDILECLKIEEPNILNSVQKSQNLMSLETQMALLALSENLFEAVEINQILVKEITSNKESWITNIGLKALVTACKCHDITIHELTLDDKLDIFKATTIAGKMAQCLNIYEDIFEMVS